MGWYLFLVTMMAIVCIIQSETGFYPASGETGAKLSGQHEVINALFPAPAALHVAIPQVRHKMPHVICPAFAQGNDGYVLTQKRKKLLNTL